MKHLILLLALLTLNSCSSLLTSRRRCPEFQGAPVPAYSNGDYSKFLKDNNVTLATNVSLYEMEHFIDHYNKVPLSLRTELIREGATINLIHGDSIADDPSWDKSTPANPEDWRTGSSMIGVSGWPFYQKQAKEYNKELTDKYTYLQQLCALQRFNPDCKIDYSDSALKAKLLPDNFPTRIVVNYLDAAGLVLHEIGHSLDLLYSKGNISSSARWETLLQEEPDSGNFLKMLCEGQYCYTRKHEGFAELFSYYHSCDNTRTQMEKEIPRIADFFKNLSSVEDYIKK